MPSSSTPSNLSQFQLRTLFVGVGLLGVVFGIARMGGWGVSLALVTFIALAAAHVIGNVLGTRLRDEVSPQLNQTPAHLPHAVDLDQRRIEGRLNQRTPLGRIIRVTSGGGAILGAIFGGMALAAWTSAGPTGWLVGALSSAALGGFFAFLLASFLEMALRAWWQAAGRE